jgi:tetratricopeptide (TPR) repeat protein
MTTLCLNMIVKNESKIIERMLNSVLPIIDCYCICDTGSTDNTKELITNYFLERNIPGKIVEEPFLNFCHNRNFALNACQGMSDFVLLMDADMVLQISDFNKNNLELFDAYRLLQGNDSFYYQNTRIVRNNGLYSYFGVTHEYLNVPPSNRMGSLRKSELFILDIGDGGSKDNKYERDIHLLTQGLIEEPRNERYHFYLANSYFDHGDFLQAIEMYRKRIDLKGWDQEVWYSYYRIGLSYKRLGRMAEAVYTWLKAFDYMPTRVENLYEIIEHYRVISNHKLCHLFYDMATKVIQQSRHNLDNFLFLQKDVYDYKIDYEYTIIALYVGITNINDKVVSILNASNHFPINANLLSNLKFYKSILTPQRIINLDETICKDVNGIQTEFLSSSSCLIPNKETDTYYLNVRFVNYVIDDNGQYHKCDNHIITMNKFVELSKDLKIIREKQFDLEFVERRYIGTEDVRIFRDTNDRIRFIGTGYHTNNQIGVVSGQYNIMENNIKAVELKCLFKNQCEKNWVFVNYHDKTLIVYNWFPLQLCKQELNDTITVVKEVQMPRIFSYARGSSSGFQFKDELWFVIHIVSHESPRHYYHLIVVFDKDMNLKRYSAPFKFEGTPIEFCLSIVVEQERVLINYSTWDRTTRIGVYNKDYIDSILKYIV